MLPFHPVTAVVLVHIAQIFQLLLCRPCGIGIHSRRQHKTQVTVIVVHVIGAQDLVHIRGTALVGIESPF
ncbi:MULTISPECIES: hypothetical protein [unclassified Olivibacter]|uniref:hypothetical protein n=1 Tax=unclassified Olivibacter TaxID=2632301 RepID=UPI00143D06C4|nr:MULTISPECIES: hypothetical protein [unclassified Olivibacter]